jgi:hypothetical protein
MVDRMRRIDFGVNCYLIDVEGGYVLIDTSFPNKRDKLDAELTHVSATHPHHIRMQKIGGKTSSSGLFLLPSCQI